MGSHQLQLLHPAILTLPLKLWKQSGCASQPALSVTSSGTGCPGLKRGKKKKERPHYVVGNPYEIKCYELPIAQHPIFLTYPVSHIVF